VEPGGGITRHVLSAKHSGTRRFPSVAIGGAIALLAAEIDAQVDESHKCGVDVAWGVLACRA
jgi:hypothetical protein